MNILPPSHAIRFAPIIFMLFPLLSFAGIVTYPIATSIDKSGSSHVNILSNSPNVEFIKATVKQVMYPGSPQQKEVIVTQSTNNGLVIAPTKFAVTSGETRTIRMINIQPPQSESVYRVYFESVPKPGLEQTTDGHTQANIGLNMIWGVLVNVPPAQPKLDFIYDSKSHQITNTGNIHLKISSIGLCPQGKSSDGCIWSKEVKKCIYPGQQKILPDNLFSGKKYRAVRIKYINWTDKTSSEKEFTA